MQKGTIVIVVIAASIAVTSTALLLFTIIGKPINQTMTAVTTTPNYTETDFQQKSSNTTRDGVVVTVEGLKTRYPSGEALYFTVTAKGNGIFCPKPIASIVKPETGELVWLISGGAACQQTHTQEIDKTWTLDDIEDSSFPLLVGQLFGSGAYKLVVEYNGATITQDFFQE